MHAAIASLLVLGPCSALVAQVRPGEAILEFTATLRVSSPAGVGTEVAHREGNSHLDVALSGWCTVAANTIRGRTLYSVLAGAPHAVTLEVGNGAAVQGEETGEGDSRVRYAAQESRSLTAAFPVDQLGIMLTFDPGSETWSGHFLPLDPIGSFRQAMQYAGSAVWQPLTTGFGEARSYAGSDEWNRGKGWSMTPPGIDPNQLPTAIFGGSRPGEAPAVPAQVEGETRRGRVEIRNVATQVAIEWTVRPAAADVEFVVVADDYEAWWPSAGTTTATAHEPGEELLFLGELRPAPGAPATMELPKLTRVTWRLEETSTEPGVAVNFPYRSTDRSVDFRLRPALGEIVGADAQQVVEQPLGHRSRVAVTPYDFGGTAVLTVTAELEGKPPVRGRMLVRGRKVDRILLPDREPSSRIARSWLDLVGMRGSADASDDDPLPTGKPGVHGDGFSLYEEYRGCFAQGRHTRLDPNFKDLFVCNSAGALADRAIARFDRISQLVITRLAPAELPRASTGDRVVNVNRSSSGPQQTAVFLRPTSVFARPNDLIPRGSRPATVDAIKVPSAGVGLAEISPWLGREQHGSKTSAVVEHFVLQALFQTVGVDRPGPSGRLCVITFHPPADASGAPRASLGGEDIQVLDEAGNDMVQGWWNLQLRHAPPAERFLRTYTRRWLVAERGMAFGGPDDCVMRDWFADLYRSRQEASPPIYRLVRPNGERPGGVLCRICSGTGVNAPDRRPDSRYGPRLVGIPASAQLVVRDSAP